MKNFDHSVPDVSASETSKLARHRWYYFKEAFSPGIVDHAIRSSGIKAGATVYDPFSGSGTTVLSAVERGFPAYGTEVNPFLRFVAAAKTSSTTKHKLSRAFESVFAGTNSTRRHHLETFSTFSEFGSASKKRHKWLFNSSVLRSFGGAWRASASVAQNERRLCRLALIGAVMDAANAEKDGKCLRFKTAWEGLQLGRSDFKYALETRRDQMLADCEALTLQAAPKSAIAYGDSRRIVAPTEFDLCVTSPPYLNSFDYTDVYRPELFLSGSIRSMDQLRRLRMKTLRSHVQAKWESPIDVEFGKHYADAIARLEKNKALLWNNRIPEMVQAYFEDMAAVFLNLRSKARRDATVWLVVSTSAYAGIEVPVDLILADVAANNGWFLREVTVLRHLRRVSGQQWHRLNESSGGAGPYLRESLVVLDAAPVERAFKRKISKQPFQS
jgi:hypothetical protein